MKHIVVAALTLTIFSGSSAYASGLTDPILEQDLIIEDAKAGSSSSPVILVALTGLMMWAVIAQ
ncbi:hypothetical protein [Planktotalea sp.]|uniref:hypothetical protein n=1 Tax=Planktotalea sp. TaxID=2029877 RepID=UPI003D6AF69C